MSRLRRTRVLLRLLVGSSLLALSAVAVTGVADAAKKKRSCKAEKEQKGCKLPVAANFSGTLKGGGGVSVYVAKKSATVSVTAVDPFRSGGACSSSFDRTTAVINKRLKVGKSYKLSVKRATPGTWNNINGKLKIKSAKKAVLSGSYVSHTKDEVTRKETNIVRCQRDLKTTAKRGG